MRDALRLTLAAVLAGLLLCAPVRAAGSNPVQPSMPAPDKPAKDRAFEPIYRVLVDPRCMNCHTATDFPRQGDERRPHDFLVRRGADGNGAAAMRCATCHTAGNNGTFPDAPKWGLAPLSMAWEGLGPRQLCLRLKNPQQNGQRDVAQLIEHMSFDPLVVWGWAPGGGRRPVEMPKDDFVRALRFWADAGAPCPSR